MVDWQGVIDEFYEPDSGLRDILLRHSRSVARLALDIAHARGLDLADDDIEAAAMLHDIGIFLTDAPGIQCTGREPYIRHGILGGALLRGQGLPEWVARVAERHTGAGITADEIVRNKLPLPAVDLVPESLLERLVCYADKFYSKSGDMRRKTLDHVRASIQKHFPDSAPRFQALVDEFGAPPADD